MTHKPPMKLMLSKACEEKKLWPETETENHKGQSKSSELNPKPMHIADAKRFGFTHHCDANRLV